MQRLSVFHMLKIGIGPSSSHTMGPWRAAAAFVAGLPLAAVTSVTAHLYGSLAKTGRGHGTDVAVMMGLTGADPVTFDPAQLTPTVAAIRTQHVIRLGNARDLAFDPAESVVFHYDESLPAHPNGLRFEAALVGGGAISETYYSVGGGFILRDGETQASEAVTLPYPGDCAADIQGHCTRHGLALWQMVLANEQAWRSEADVLAGLDALWAAMLGCAYRGCHTQGELPGGLRVARRAAEMHARLLPGPAAPDPAAWLARLQQTRPNFDDLLKWVSVFAMAVNEENAAFGRVVTAPTNGAAGVIPAVLLYHVVFHRADQDAIRRFLLVAGEIGTLFKKGATISAAQGGCQAEIGVSSAMAAAALAEGLGASVDQALMAAEIAMEHHLGLTCDPVGGLVQIPCIERNAMGAMKAITAANIALASQPEHARVSLDAVIRSMWQTAQDMSDKYKETAEGGLALHIPVNVVEC